jgi:hypothetical protein
MAILCITTCMMMLQKYQFEHRDCLHISYHKDVEISLAKKKFKSFKFIVAMGRCQYLSLIATLGHCQEGLVTVAMGEGHVTRTVATKDHSSTGRRLSSARCYYDQARLPAT